MGQTRKWVLLSIYEQWALFFLHLTMCLRPHICFIEVHRGFIWFIEEEVEVQRGSVMLQIAAKLGSNLA